METLLLLADRYVAEPLEGFVLDYGSRHITWVTDKTTSVKGSWYLSPKQHAVEFILFNAIILSCFLLFYRIAIREK